jgi:nitrate/TMAO reductase-like tetraheme cytochrome c subunit
MPSHSTPEYNRQYYQDHKEQNIAKATLWRINHPKEMRAIQKRQKSKLRSILLEAIGSECKICHSTKMIEFHEIHDKRHKTDNYYYLKHLKDFVPLCISCHKIYHLQKWKINWNMLLTV